MWLPTIKSAYLAGLFLLLGGIAHATPPLTPPGPPTKLPRPPLNHPGLKHPGPPSKVQGPPGLSVAASRVQAVPIPATTLTLFGAGLLAMPWLRPRAK